MDMEPGEMREKVESGENEVFQMDEEDEEEEEEDDEEKIVKITPQKFTQSPKKAATGQTKKQQQQQECSGVNHGHGNIPTLFFNLYFGCGAVTYSLLTTWVFVACCFGSDSFGTSGVFYMLSIAGLMWLSTILTFISSHLSGELGTKDIHRRPTILFAFALLLKICVDASIFYGSIEALRDPNLVHYHEFSQFVGPVMYFGLLYLVTIIVLVVILTTTAIMEDRCGIYATFLKVQKVKMQAETYLRSKFPPPAQV